MARIKYIIILYICLLNLFVQTATAQTGRIQGKVIDTFGNSIPNLHVLVMGTDLGSITNTAGEFDIGPLKSGKYTLKFDHIGFKPRIIAGIMVMEDLTTRIESVTLHTRILEMEGVVISATRSEKKVTDISIPVNLIPEKTIQERNAKTSSEALREETAIFIQKTGHGGGSAIIRGLSSNQILLLVDGIRLNNSTYRLGNHQYLTTIDNNIARQIEVIRGPASVLYGSDALGGTINVLTKSPAFEGENLQASYRLSSRYASADQEKTGRAELGIHDSRFSFLTGLSYSDFGDLRRGQNSRYPELENATHGAIQNPTGFQTWNSDAKAAFKLSKKQILTIAYQISRKKDVPRYDKYENDGYFKWLYTPQKRDLVYLIYQNSFSEKWLSSIKMTASCHRQEEGREIQKNETDPLTSELDRVNTFGWQLQLQNRLKGHLFTWGTELYHDHVKSQRIFINTLTGIRERDIQGRYPDGAFYTGFGFFLQDEMIITSRLSGTAGVRYSYYHTEFGIPEDSSFSYLPDRISQEFQSVTGSMGLLYKLSEITFFNINLGQAFRAPNLNDLAKLGESKGNTYEIPNPDLEPENMVSFDIGIKMAASRFHWNFNAYHAWIQNILSSADTKLNGSSTIEINNETYKIKTKKNLGKARIYGLELDFSWNSREDIILYGNGCFTFGQNVTTREPVGGIPPAFGLMGLMWKKDRYDLSLYTRFAEKQNRLSSDDHDDPRIPDGGTPKWMTWNIRASWEAWHGLQLRFALENVFDVNYREHGSGVNGPGRNFIVSLTLANPGFLNK